jgi:hypothetical protein
MQRQFKSSAGHPEWLPATITRTIRSTVYVDPPKLADLESALGKLGATGRADSTTVIGSTTYIQPWTLEEILTAIREVNG